MKQEELENYIYTYGKDIYSFCCCVTRSRQEADDLYQETFLKLYEMGDELVIRTNPKSFLMGVAFNLYRNDKRKLSVRQRIIGVSVSIDASSEDIPFVGQETEDMVISREECQIIRKAVAKLPDKYRIPILLYYMEELSQADIAAMMRISEGAVKSRLHRAKKILKEQLEGLL
ncbi:MAG: RNA polymerase sigma factor [Lachnospiraceae bacterium]|nr:RNA polymerase sigma factor [Lachnospiraceae bacterium]